MDDSGSPARAHEPDRKCGAGLRPHPVLRTRISGRQPTWQPHTRALNLPAGCLQRPDNRLLGRYSFNLPESLARSELRRLRDPNDPEKQEIQVASYRFFVPLIPIRVVKRRVRADASGRRDRMAGLF
jgi:hypothetical protein